MDLHVRAVALSHTLYTHELSDSQFICIPVIYCTVLSMLIFTWKDPLNVHCMWMCVEDPSKARFLCILAPIEGHIHQGYEDSLGN